MFNKDRSYPVEPAAGMEVISNSRVAGIICATLGKDNTKYILDFGTIDQNIIDFFSQYSCQYDVVDFENILTEMDFFQDGANEEEADEDSKERIFSSIEQQILAMIPNYGMQKYDAIFLWDIFSYLEDWQIKRIFNILEPLCHWKTNLLIVFSVKKQINSRPMLCSIIDHDSIRYRSRPDAEGVISNPGHEKNGFSLLAKKFELSHSSLSLHGIKECIYALKRPEA